MSFFTSTTRLEWENAIDQHLNRKMAEDEKIRESLAEGKAKVFWGKEKEEEKGMKAKEEEAFLTDDEDDDEEGLLNNNINNINNINNNNNNNNNNDNDDGFYSPSKDELRRPKGDLKSRKRHLSSQTNDKRTVKRKLNFNEYDIGVSRKRVGEKQLTECLASSEGVEMKQSTGCWASSEGVGEKQSTEVLNVCQAIEEGTDLTRRLRNCVDLLGKYVCLFLCFSVCRSFA